MKKLWIKLTKYYRNGEYSDYLYVDEEELGESLLEEWGESTDGGQNYGYRVESHILEEGEYPPKEWLEKRIKRGAGKVTIYESMLNKEKQLIELCKSLL